MENFRQQFLLDSVKKLKNLQNKLCDAEKFPDAERSEVFRTLHTIKGTAQTFGFDSVSRLAHELETILADQTVSTENLNSLFNEGIELLINSFEQKDFEFPAQFVEVGDHSGANYADNCDNSQDNFNAVFSFHIEVQIGVST